MTKEEKINKIKHWLQHNGERDEDGFSFDSGLDTSPLYLSLQYDYDSEGNRIEPFCLCKLNDKLFGEYLHDRTEEELDMIIKLLYSKNHG